MHTINSKKIPSSEKVIGIDCGTAIVGWAIVERTHNKLKHIAHGSVKTDKNDVMYLRLKKIYSDLQELISLYKPDSMAVEDLFFFKNQKTVISVSQARGVILLSGTNNNLPVFDYTPLQVKSAITGYGRAEKQQVAMMVGKILELKDIPKLDDVTDAIGVAICHLNTNNYVR